MKKNLFFVLMLIASCSSKTTEKPENLIDKDLIESIIADISKSNATIELEQLDNNDLISTRKLLAYESIFEHYQITEEQFEASYIYYLADLDSAAALYDKVLEKLSIEEIELNKTENNE